MQSTGPKPCRPPPRRETAIKRARLALVAPPAQPLGRCPLADAGGLGRRPQRPALALDPCDDQPSAIRTGARVSVELHPVSSLVLGGFDTPSLQGGPDEQRGEELELVAGANQTGQLIFA